MSKKKKVWRIITDVIKKIICVFGGIILLLAVQASISSILRLINPIEEPAEEKKELEVEHKRILYR